jgi:hypothetical protein
MFLCDKCHDPEQHIALFRSYGRCEGCGKTAPCIDCHIMNCHPVKKKQTTAGKTHAPHRTRT